MGDVKWCAVDGCTNMVPFDSMNRQRGRYCADKACQRTRERLKKARQRARAGEVAPAPVEDTLGGFTAPWGMPYADVAKAFADCLLVGGLDGSVSPDECVRRRVLMAEHGALTPHSCSGMP